MVATSRSSHEPASTASVPAGSEPGAADRDAVAAARTVARLFPEVYRRYHWANRVHGGDLPVTQWTMRREGLDYAAAREKARGYMKTMPAWRDAAL
jgi:hypothetical protein